MASAALNVWQNGAAASLDEVVAAHVQLGGTRPGRRALTEVNYAYVIRLAAHFQGYVRSLHSEAALAIAASVPDPALRLVVQSRLTEGRILDRGNANLGNIGSDFGRFGFSLWREVDEAHRHSNSRRLKLEQMLEWRNGIAHDDLERRRRSGTLVPDRMTMPACRSWRRALDNLALTIDDVVAAQCVDLGAQRPW